ncbi:MAG: hypothetical protein OEM82_07350 [Acidobacteriota bacterium]|nr:hypothetical protein [Acidobacteriota bacterium]MDH3528070.1 hypothetical protein [Acidobacteriota bacterium]
MAVKLDAAHVAAKKTMSFASQAVKKTVKAASSVVKSTAPSANAAVTAKKASWNLHAAVAKQNLRNSYTASTTPRERADEIIKNNGGRDNLNTDNAGRDLGVMAVSDPAAALEVSILVLDQVKENDRDEVAQSFADSLSEDQLAAIASDARGTELLELHRKNVLDGKVHRDERATALRLQNAIQRYPTPELTGNHENDIRTMASDLEGLPPEKQAEYLKEILAHPYGIETLERAAVLNAEEQKVLASALSSAYTANPSSVNSAFRSTLESERLFPVTQWSGFANVVSQTGNDALIASYGRMAINHAASNPDHHAVSVDAMQALSGLTPGALASFINFRSIVPPRSGSLQGIGQAIQTNQAQFQTVLQDAADWLDADANNSGFANPWAFNPALGNLLDTASQMTNRDGTPTEAALKIFEAVATKTGDNFFTKEAAGRFFIEHSQAVVDKYASLRNPDGSANRIAPDVLKDFFIGVVYSPISHLLEYNGRSMVETIMGDGAGNQGIIGDVAATLMYRAAKGGNPEDIGRELGYLFGAISGGFLDAVEAYKDKFDDDKKFREFMYGIVNKGLGAFGKKAGIPLEKIASFAEKLYEAGKSRERSARLRGFQKAFLELKDEMRFSLLETENANPQTKGIEESFTISWTDFIASYLATDWIAN